MSLTLQQSAALIGSHCWAERRLFEVLGGWSARAASPAAVLTLDRHSQHAAWRGGQWWDRLPLLAGVDREDLVVPGPAWWALEGAGPEGDADSDAIRLARAYRVALPRLAVAYAHHEAVTTEAADGSVRRTLGHVRPDITTDWVEGEAVLQSLLIDRAAVDDAAAAVREAERRFVPVATG